jgi:hypothetical protein
MPIHNNVDWGIAKNKLYFALRLQADVIDLRFDQSLLSDLLTGPNTAILLIGYGGVSLAVKLKRDALP